MTGVAGKGRHLVGNSGLVAENGYGNSHLVRRRGKREKVGTRRAKAVKVERRLIDGKGEKKRRNGRKRKGKKGYRRDSFADEDPKMTNSSLDLFPTVNRAHQPKGR